MHRMTPANSAYRAFTSGGARSVVDKADDTKLMQEMGGNMMASESRSKIESPQNYGFSSVVAKATKGQDGKMQGAETFVQFMGGNRSFPVAGNMDDRRHRLKELEEGDTAMFGQREWGQQFHVNKKGMFMSGSFAEVEQDQGGGGGGGGSGGSGQQETRKIKLQLVENNQDEQQSQQQQANGSGGGGSGSGQQQSKAKGQKKLYDKESTRSVEIAKDKITAHHGDCKVIVEDKKILCQWKDDTVSMRVDEKHVHIRYKGMRIWVDETGCYSTKAMEVKEDPNDN
jgi:phage gp45-like